MKFRTIRNSVIIVGLVMVLIWALSGILDSQRVEKTYYVTVLVENSDNDSWFAARQGMEQAAEEKGIILNYLHTTDFADVEAEMDQLNSEISNGANGIMLSLKNGDLNMEEFEKTLSSANILFLGSGPNEDQVYNVIGADYYQMGYDLGKKIIEEQMRNTGALQVGLLYEGDSLPAREKELRGLSDALNEEGFEITFCLDLNYDKMGNQAIHGLIDVQPRVDVLVGFGDIMTECLLDYKLNGRGQSVEAAIYGEGYSEKLIYYLDRGLIAGLAVQNEYDLGYKSVEKIAGMLMNPLSDKTEETVGFILVDGKNLYDENNQKLLFPIVQ